MDVIVRTYPSDPGCIIHSGTQSTSVYIDPFHKWWPKNEKQEKLQVLVFNIVCGMGSEVT